MLKKKELTAKTVRKLFSNKKELSERLSIEENNIYLDFDMSTIDKLHFKNFKGIYTIITKKPLNESYTLDVYSLGQDEKKLKLGEQFLHEIELLENWNVSGHENVFKFKMVSINLGTLQIQEVNGTNSEPEFLICGMKYNSTVVALVVGMKESMRNWK